MDVPTRRSDDDRPRPVIDPSKLGRPPIGRLPAVASDPVISVPPEVLARYNARVLDPATATKVAGQRRVRSTVYIGDQLLVSGAADDSTFEMLMKAAQSKGLTLDRPQDRAGRREDLVSVGREAGLENAGSVFHEVVQLQPAKGTAAAPDAWEVLQTFRAMAGLDNDSTRLVGLNHLLAATRYTHGSPFDRRGPSATSSYADPGSGGRMPVAWIGGPPHRRGDDELGRRRPVVAVLDTGIEDHPWFTPDVVSRASLPTAFATQLMTAVIDNPLEGTLAPLAGHGTFIAGLIRQVCPDANLLDLRVMGNDGVVPEDLLLDALCLLAARQHKAQQSGDATSVVDVVSLSLGYYHELQEDLAYDGFIRQPLQMLSGMGVAVVVSAGNDATSRPMFPAAFYPHAGGEVPAPLAAAVPLISVGALNPDGTTALFSNAGDWVGCHRPGAELVSTFPVSLDAAAQAAFRNGNAPTVRATIDPDDFSSGFGTWSGTSFAAPVLAGELAAALADGSCGNLDELDAGLSVTRGWAAITARTGLACP
jgi:subtilisin family serine protease